MNINGSGITKRMQHQQGGLNINGNGNTIEIVNSMMAITLMGNGNIIRIKGCSVQIQCNGNSNIFDCKNSSVQIGINGNRNQLIQSQTAVKVMHNNGVENHIDKGDQLNFGMELSQSSQVNNQNQQMNPMDLLFAVQQYAQSFENTNNNNNPYTSIRNSQQNPVQTSVYANNPYALNTHSNYNPQNNRNNQPPQQSQQSRNPRRINFNSNNNQASLTRPLNRNQPDRNSHSNRQENHRNNRPQESVRNYREPPREQPQQSVVTSNLFTSKSIFSSDNTDGFSLQELQMFPVSYYEGASKQCTICLQPLRPGQKVMYLMCFHCFHENCGKDWLKKASKCPMCQINIRELMSKSKYMKMMQ